LAVALLLAYATIVEPNWIDVTRHHVDISGARAFRIAVLSDLHSAGMGFLERQVIEVLLREKPDVILVAGDSASDDGDKVDAELILRRLAAPLGVWFVPGNWEYWRFTSGDPDRFYDVPNMKTLRNDAVALVDSIWLVGIDDSLAGSPDPEAAFRKVPSGSFTIALFHSPDLFDELAPQLDLAFAGHTHGGQVRLPFVGALWLPPNSGRFQAGWYDSGGARLYVSRGIGTSILPVRLFCRPEIALFEVNTGAGD
jgi:hypothetical protein